MKKMQIGLVKAGDKLAKPVFRENGTVLLGQGIELNERYLERLRGLGIDVLFIEDAATEGIEPEEVIRDDTRRKATETIYKTIKSFKDPATTSGKSIAPDVARSLKDVFGDIIQDLSHRPNILVNLSTIHEKDAYLFQHSFNVTVLAGIMGIAKSYNRYQLEELGVGALLYDIGMTRVPGEIINKQGQLTPEEFEIVQKHTTDGFQILRKYHDISLLSSHCALQHHERYNGSGYPRGLKGNEIHEYAQIIALADTFDALTSPRPYRKRYTNMEAVEFLFAAGGTYFDLDLIKLFCRHISIYPVSTTLLLNTGQTAVVSENTELALHRPRVRIIMEADGSKPKEPYELDLKDQLHITIVQEL